VAVIALVDGEHHPAAVRAALDRLDAERGLAGVVFCGGEEKLRGGSLEELYGRPVESDMEGGLRRLAASADAVVDLADEPVLSPAERLRLAALALHLGLGYESPGLRLVPPAYAPIAFDRPKLAVIASGKRTGKTAVAGHWARLLAGRGVDPVLVCMSRGGPPEPELAEAGMGVDELLELSRRGRHAASDHLEGAALAGVRAVGCRRVGGGLAGAPAESNVERGAELAASLGPDALIFEGSGACIPPVEVDRTVCIAGPGALEALGAYRLLRADLALVAEGGEVDGLCGRVVRFEMRPEPVDPVPDGARVAVFTTGAAPPEGVDAVVGSTNLSRRAALTDDLDRAVAERCDLWLTELKGAAIDTVAERARREGAGIAFLRNRPVGLDGDLDAELLELAGA
jgi:cyclic 2,3-diphosphoglycerate synthetase